LGLLLVWDGGFESSLASGGVSVNACAGKASNNIAMKVSREGIHNLTEWIDAIVFRSI
jgi:hypothetical protein